MHFENITVQDGSIEATIAEDKTTINYEMELLEPGDFYIFTVDMVNSGSIDAMIDEVLIYRRTRKIY